MLTLVILADPKVYKILLLKTLRTGLASRRQKYKSIPNFPLICCVFPVKGFGTPATLFSDSV